MEKVENLVTDLRHLDCGTRLQASPELKEIIRSWSLQRPAEKLNERLKEKTDQRRAEQSRWRTENHEEHEENRFAHGECSVVDLNERIAQRTRRSFETSSQPPR
jgi:hypothetical protein